MTATLLAMPVTSSAPHTGAAYAGTWLEVLSHLDRSYGGLTAVVPAMAANLKRQAGIDAHLAAFCVPGEDTAGAPVPVSVWPANHAQWLASRRLRLRFAGEIAAASGIHIHGLWDASAAWTAREARRQRKPYVLSAHGMLERWALAQKATKKRVYGALVERQTLQGAAWLHALTMAEAEDYRRFGCTRPIAIIPNAVEAPARIDSELVTQRFPAFQGRRVVLFLGRLHVKKGIELLLNGWSAVRAAHPDALLVLAGPGEQGYVESLRAKTHERGIADDVVFAGMLDGDTKWSALARAHVFILPSYSEGLSVATLEALAAGTPVIVTEACHLPEVAQAGCGWQTPTATEPLQQALLESLAQPSAERNAMGKRARQLAEERFSWNVVCAHMAELYRCVLKGDVPQGFAWLEAVR